MKPLSFILAIAALGSCVSYNQPVSLGQLRHSDAASQDAQAYDTLQKAVGLANDFLEKSPLVTGHPAEKAHFDFGVNNIILRLGNELVTRYDLVITIHRASRPAKPAYPQHWPRPASDNPFLQLPEARMAAALLSKSVAMRQIQAKGKVDDWLDYDLLGAGTWSGWGGNRPALTEQAFYQWHAGL